jgi:hypothetical protein
LRLPDDRGTPFDFVLGQGSVIKGWDLGVSGMCPGEMRKLQVRLRWRNAPSETRPAPTQHPPARGRYARRRRDAAHRRGVRGRGCALER